MDNLADAAEQLGGITVPQEEPSDRPVELENVDSTGIYYFFLFIDTSA